MFIKTGTKHASKDEIELVIFEAFLKLLLGIWVLGLRLAALLFFGLSFSHTVVYGTHKQAHNQEKKQTFYRRARIGRILKQGGRKNIFERFSNGTAGIRLETEW